MQWCYFLQSGDNIRAGGVGARGELVKSSEKVTLKRARENSKVPASPLDNIGLGPAAGMETITIVIVVY